jgi:glycosyltransferase involved in cell wall biosynthesis
MKIAMMVLGYVPLPRPSDMIYAPADIAVSIAEGLARKGHQVDLFGPLGSRSNDPHITVQTLNLRPLAQTQREMRRLFRSSDRFTNYVPQIWDQYFAKEMFVRASHGVYDVLHFHHPEIALPLAKAFTNVQVVYTLHDPITSWYRELLELYETPNQHHISISMNQRRDAPDLPYIANIYNGTYLHNFTFSAAHEDYLLYVGRIVPEKGVKEAVRVARETNHRLLIIGTVYPDSQGYFDQYIKPFLNNRILYLGFIEQSHLSQYYQNAKALLTPVQWEEPFGLTTIEAMACGTPVISLQRGAAPEIIQDGETGFVVDSIADMITAVGNIERINRRACRKHVETKFSLTHMVDAYEQAFLKLVPPLQRKLMHPQPVIQKQLKRVPFRFRRQKPGTGGKTYPAS